MAKAEYRDDKANAIVLGSLINDTSILEDTTTYQMNVGDFTTPLQRVVFSAVNNLFVKGLLEIDATDIYRYLETSGSEGQRNIFEEQHGVDYVQHCVELSKGNKISYYYDQMKKFSLLRSLQDVGFNTRAIYDPDELDIERMSKQKQYLSQTDVDEIAQDVLDVLEEAIQDYNLSGVEGSREAGTGITELLDGLLESPAIGFETYDAILTKVMMGMQHGKYSVISAVSGGGKTRQMAAMCAHISASHTYCLKTAKWRELSTKVPSLFIATEQDLQEIQTLLLANISKVNEEHILDPRLYVGDEEKRVREAARIIESSPIHIAELPDFGLQSIENTIRVAIKEHNIEFAFFDYINSSVTLLQEIGMANIQEHQILYLLSTNLKTLATSYGIGVMTATQTNRSAMGSSEADSSMLKGSSAIIEKADFGAIMMKLSDDDKAQLPNLLANSSSEGKPEPNMVLSIYKNRRSKYNNGKLWMHVDLGMCTFETIFYTDHDYNIQDIEGYKVEYTE